MNAHNKPTAKESKMTTIQCLKDADFNRIYAQLVRATPGTYGPHEAAHPFTKKQDGSFVVDGATHQIMGAAVAIFNAWRAEMAAAGNY